eukprot:Em0888g2a
MKSFAENPAPAKCHRTGGSEALKCQMLVDTLTHHLQPHVTLDHIKGVDIAHGDILAVRHLLDIFALLLHVTEAEDHSGHVTAPCTNSLPNKGYTFVSEAVSPNPNLSNTSHFLSIEPLSPTQSIEKPCMHPNLPEVELAATSQHSTCDNQVQSVLSNAHSTQKELWSEQKQRKKVHHSKRKRLQHTPPKSEHMDSSFPTAGNNILNLVNEQFPGIYTSPATLRRLWQKQLKQMMSLTKPSTASTQKVAQVNEQHESLLQLIRRDLEHTRRMQRQRELKQEQQAVRSSVHNQRLAAARARRYYSEYELRLKAKLQKRRTKEEQVFRQAFEEVLELQKERVREVKKYAREKQKERRNRRVISRWRHWRISTKTNSSCWPSRLPGKRSRWKSERKHSMRW